MAGGKFIVMEPDNNATGIGASFVYGRDIMNKSDDFRIAMTKSFDKMFVNYNFGYNGHIYNIGFVGIPFADDFSYFVEFSNDSFNNRIHTGLTWIPKRDLQLDTNVDS